MGVRRIRVNEYLLYRVNTILAPTEGLLSKDFILISKYSTLFSLRSLLCSCRSITLLFPATLRSVIHLKFKTYEIKRFILLTGHSCFSAAHDEFLYRLRTAVPKRSVDETRLRPS